MQDRDSFYYRAIRTKLGDARKAQHDLNDPLPNQQESVAAGGKEPKGLDLFLREQPVARRRDP
jgi:hypothetical protein